MDKRHSWLAFGWLAGLLVAVTVVFSAVPAGAQSSRTLYWNRWDVAIDNVDVTANRFDVAEIHEIQFTSGEFRFGYRNIPLERLDSIQNVRVAEGELELQQTTTCTERAGTYCVRTNSNELEIIYYFLSRAQNEQRTFFIRYEVYGALRAYEGGDQLDWFAIAPDHAFPIRNSMVTVRLPEGYAPREGVDPVVSYFAPTDVTVQDTLVTYTATREIAVNEPLEVRVQYPHSPDMQRGAWQDAFDLEATVGPLLNLVVLGGSVLLLILGPLGVYYLWYSRGRDPEIGVVPEYLSEPPSDLAPAIAGTLVDERADLQDVMSTLIDLAKRGYLIIEESQERNLLGTQNKFTFKRTDKPADDLRRFERYLLERVFRGGDVRELDDLKNKFYTAIPTLKQHLYREAVEQGFFDASPETTRQRWVGLGSVLMIIAVFGGFALFALMEETFIQALYCVPIALGITALAMLISANAMPAKTLKGAEEAAKWRAFKEYLSNVRRYTDLESATEQFNEYMPYAVAFGLERTWISAFARVESTPIPYWYYPVYMGGPWRHGYHRGGPVVDMRNPDIRGQLAGSGFSLDRASTNISSGLNNMSVGLSTMLTSAASVFTSQPASTGSSGSWSGGGGGFSGGFSGGGGGGGGGGAGFG